MTSASFNLAVRKRVSLFHFICFAFPWEEIFWSAPWSNRQTHRFHILLTGRTCPDSKVSAEACIYFATDLKCATSPFPHNSGSLGRSQ